MRRFPPRAARSMAATAPGAATCMSSAWVIVPMAVRLASRPWCGTSRALVVRLVRVAPEALPASRGHMEPPVRTARMAPPGPTAPREPRVRQVRPVALRVHRVRLVRRALRVRRAQPARRVRPESARKAPLESAHRARLESAPRVRTARRVRLARRARPELKVRKVTKVRKALQALWGLCWHSVLAATCRRQLAQTVELLPVVDTRVARHRHPRRSAVARPRPRLAGRPRLPCLGTAASLRMHCVLRVPCRTRRLPIATVGREQSSPRPAAFATDQHINGPPWRGPSLIASRFAFTYGMESSSCTGDG
jgi:hypothetical protein